MLATVWAQQGQRMEDASGGVSGGGGAAHCRGAKTRAMVAVEGCGRVEELHRHAGDVRAVQGQWLRLLSSERMA